MKHRKILLLIPVCIICIVSALQYFSLLGSVVPNVTQQNNAFLVQLYNTTTTTNETLITHHNITTTATAPTDESTLNNSNSSTTSTTITESVLPQPSPPYPSITSLPTVSIQLLGEALKRESKRTCFMPYKYHILYQKSVHDTYQGSCTPEHTTYDESSHAIHMKCAQSTHVPYIYMSNVHRNISSDFPHWKPYPTETYLKGEWLKLPSGQSLIHTACIDRDKRSSYHSFRTRVWRDENIVNRSKESLSQWKNKNDSQGRPIDIRVIIADCVGKSMFHRHFPHTKQFLSELSSSNTGVSVLELENYQVVGFNSIVNMYQFSTGRSVSVDTPFNDTLLLPDLRQRLEGGPVKIPLLWDHLKSMGYVTSVGEDASNSGATAGSIYGYRDQVLTYDIFPHFHGAASYVDNQLRMGYIFEARVCPCVGSRFMSSVMFEFSRSMFSAYRDVPKFLLTVNDESHDTVGNQIMMLDPDLKRYLRHLNESGALDHTGVIIMGDHGLHYGGMYHGPHKKQAEQEHGRVFGTFILPKRMVTEQLKENVKRMVNIRDIHMTIRDMASFPIRSTTDAVSPIAQSLLHDTISPDRTCEEMMVNRQYRASCTK